MKNLLSRVLTGTMLIAFVLYCYAGVVDAARITKKLEENTKLIPPGAIAVTPNWRSMPEFKKGTEVIINEYGQVIEGTLTKETWLPCVGASQFYITNYVAAYSGGLIPGPKIIRFQNDTKVTFNDKGEVVKGTLSWGEDGWIMFPLTQTSYLFLKPVTEVSFHANGMLATCTLRYETYLHPSGWSVMLDENNKINAEYPGYVLFKGDRIIELNDKGEVLKGTINKDTKLLSPNGIKVYEAGTTVEFDEKGVVVKATKN